MRRRKEKTLESLAVVVVVLAMPRILNLQGRAGWMDDSLVAASATLESS
jgi:hypothetical protein